MKIQYSFDNRNFRDFGVFVSGSKGLIGKPPRKKPNIFEFPGESGHVADLRNVRYDPREIELTCFIKSNSAESIVSQYDGFTSLLTSATETKTLKIEVGTKSLGYQVYLSNASVLNKTFSEGVNVGTFTLKFVEPDTSIYETN